MLALPLLLSSVLNCSITGADEDLSSDWGLAPFIIGRADNPILIVASYDPDTIGDRQSALIVDAYEPNASNV